MLMPMIERSQLCSIVLSRFSGTLDWYAARTTPEPFRRELRAPTQVAVASITRIPRRLRSRGYRNSSMRVIGKKVCSEKKINYKFANLV